MPYFSSRKIIKHLLHVDKEGGYSGIGYDMIICHELMLYLGMVENFRYKVLAWDNSVVIMNYPVNFLGKPNLTK